MIFLISAAKMSFSSYLIVGNLRGYSNYAWTGKAAMRHGLKGGTAFIQYN